MPGLLGFSPTTYPPATLDAMSELLMHRSFYWRSPILSTAPMTATQIGYTPHPAPSELTSQDGIFVWFDGEIYDSHAIARDLNMPLGSDPFSAGRHLLLNAYRRGQHLELLRRVDGVFCAVVYNSNAQQVHLMSDRHGLRRLYWTVYQNTLVWVPELKALLGLPGYSPTLDRDAVEDFLGIRYLWGDRSFFAGVELLPSATVLTWDIPSITVQKTRYWHWSEMRPPVGLNLSRRRTVEDALAHSLQEAVRVRCQPHESVGITLSGGLDSRALLAAVPAECSPMPCLTYGQQNCQDTVIARQVGDRSQSPVHELEFTAQNWFTPRLQALWEMDAPCSLLHAQFAAPTRVIREQHLFTINLHGEWGDKLSGEQFFPPEQFDKFVRRQLNLDGFARSDAHRQRVLERGRAFFESLGSSSYLLAFESRMRSFISKDLRISLIEGIETRFPFIDPALQALVYAIPEMTLKESAIYYRMLDRHFPQLFKTIPWQKTGRPLSESLPRKSWHKMAERLGAKIRRVSPMTQKSVPHRKHSTLSSYPQAFADYASWLRQSPAQPFIDDLLNAPEPLYAEYLDPAGVRQDWERHLAGEDLGDRLGTVMTLELWLQQLFNSRYRNHG